MGTGGDVRHPDDKEVDEVKALIDRISPILRGQDRQVQGAVLADLLARWLAGHYVPEDRFQTILMRGRILHQHMKIVRDLTKVNAMQCRWSFRIMARSPETRSAKEQGTRSLRCAFLPSKDARTPLPQFVDKSRVSPAWKRYVSSSLL